MASFQLGYLHGWPAPTLRLAAERVKKPLMAVRSSTLSSSCEVCSFVSGCPVEGSVKVEEARSCPRHKHS
jgi:hypothetical protein